MKKYNFIFISFSVVLMLLLSISIVFCGINGSDKNEKYDDTSQVTIGATQPTDTSKTWTDSGIKASSFARGTGTESDPYIIETAAQLGYLSSTASSSSGKYYKQTYHIDLSAYYWVPISTFRGNYDGNGFTISGLFTKPNVGNYAGLFGNVTGDFSKITVIKNIGIINSYVQGGQFVGAIAGYAGFTTIENCYNSGNISGSSYVGGIVGGLGLATCYNCYNLGNVSGGTGGYIGGITGNGILGGTYSCFNVGNLTGYLDYVDGEFVISENVGGIFGYGGSANNCYNVGEVAKIFNTIKGGIMGDCANSYVNKNYYGGNCSQSTGGINNSDIAGEAEYDANLSEDTFKSYDFFSNSDNWTHDDDGEIKSYLWDLNSVWGVDGIANNGYPYFKNSMYKIDINILNPSGTQDYESGTMTVTYNGVSKTDNDQPFDYLHVYDSYIISDITPAAGYALASVTCNNGTLENLGNGQYRYTPDPTLPLSGSWDAVIEIKMEIGSYNLTIDPNGGEWNSSTEEQTFTQKYQSSKTIAAPTRYGYNFAGWALYGGNGSISSFGNIYNNYNDTFFINGTNSVGVYNNSKDGSVTHTYIAASSYGLDFPSGSRVLRVRYTGALEWGNGFYQYIYSKANGVFYTVLYAKFPEGYTLNPAYNASGDGATRTWLTTNKGTGNWRTYILRWNCGSTGSFSSINFWYLTGSTASTSKPVDLEIAFLGTYDATGLTVSEVSTAEMTYTYGGYDAKLVALWEETWLLHTSAFSGSGTQTSPYKISSAENLAYLSKQVYDGNQTYSGKYFVQTADIDLTEYNWQPIGVEQDRTGKSVYRYFQGNFDGGGYTISGIITPYGTTFAYSCQGLFGIICGSSNLTIKNVNIRDYYICGANRVGSLVGWLVVKGSNYIIENCYSNGQIISNSYAGGLIGHADERDGGNINISSSMVCGTITTKSIYAGGLVAYGSADLTYCINYASINCAGGDAGGIFGSVRVSSTIENCLNLGTISNSKDSTGGICGYFASGEISGCKNYGDINGVNYVGGIVGYFSSGSLSTSHVECEVSGSTYVGGVVGYVSSSGSFVDCGVNATIKTATASNSNGLIGQANSSEIKNCYFIGDFLNSSGSTLAMNEYVGAGTGNSVTDCYLIVNQGKTNSLNVKKDVNGFSGWVTIPSINGGNPIQKNLYYIAGVA